MGIKTGQLTKAQLKITIAEYVSARQTLADIMTEHKPVTDKIEELTFALKQHVLVTQEPIKEQKFVISPVSEHEEHKIKNVAALVAVLKGAGLNPDDFITSKTVKPTTRLTNNF